MEKTRSYTGLFIIDPDKEGSMDDVKNGIKAVFNDNSASIAGEKMSGRKALAYPIMKKSEGIYYEVTFTVLPEKVAKIRRQFQINTNIMRTLIDANN